MEYPLLILSALTHSLSEKWQGGGQGSMQRKLKKQEKAETSKLVEDLHLVFNALFHLIFPDLLN